MRREAERVARQPHTAPLKRNSGLGSGPICGISSRLLPIVIVILSGCATTTAQIPIATSCVKDAPAKPQTATESEILAMSDYAATLTVFTERLLLKAYADKAEAVISACR